MLDFESCSFFALRAVQMPCIYFSKEQGQVGGLLDVEAKNGFLKCVGHRERFLLFRINLLPPTLDW